MDDAPDPRVPRALVSTVHHAVDQKNRRDRGEPQASAPPLLQDQQPLIAI